MMFLKQKKPITHSYFNLCWVLIWNLSPGANPKEKKNRKWTLVIFPKQKQNNNLFPLQLIHSTNNSRIPSEVQVLQKKKWAGIMLVNVPKTKKKQWPTPTSTYTYNFRKPVRNPSPSFVPKEKKMKRNVSNVPK